MHPSHVFIAGVQKCGTTTLHQWLSQHPMLVSAQLSDPDSNAKEVRYFCSPLWGRGFDWYAECFSQSAGQTGRRGLDATPEYITTAQSIQRMSLVFPDAKLIVTLRDPTERAYSQFRHYRQILPVSRGWDWKQPDGTFADNIHAEFNESTTDSHHWRGLLRRGLYAEQLQCLCKHFPRCQVLVLMLEEWSRCPSETLRKLHDFLELPPIAGIDLVPHHQRRVSPANEELDPEQLGAIAELRSYYTDANEELRRWLGRPSLPWPG